MPYDFCHSPLATISDKIFKTAFVVDGDGGLKWTKIISVKKTKSIASAR